ncbi:MAG: ABC transporter permease subunit [Flaviflexus sp.]|uniref:ABC transporter permease n=1 Tax=Flaviflexus sp. TaxID=1969482 RepID=UPI00352C7C5A
MTDGLLFRIPLGEWTRDAVDWLTTNLNSFFNFIADDLLQPMYSFLNNFLLTPNLLSLAVVFTVVALLWKGWKAGAYTAGTFLLAYVLDTWVTNSSGLGWDWWLPAIILVLVAAGVYAWKGKSIGIPVAIGAAVAFAMDMWLLVSHGAEEGLQGDVDALPWWTIVVFLTVVAFAASGWKLALLAIISFAIIYGVNQWENAMSSFALVLVASIITIVIGVPIGILAAKNKWVSAIVRPILDFLQTMPAFVYLIPFVVLFGIGVVPGIVATILFSIAPAVRFTELGIRGVDREVVEAAHAFGSHPLRILGQIELPLARPTIMGGINQVIMLALSMIVIAGMVGAGGLGRDVYTSVTSVNISLGAESGLAVVLLAIYLDRVTASFGVSHKDKL